MNYNDENNVEQNDESQKKRPIRDRLSSAYDDYEDLKDKYGADGLGGIARGMAQEAINNKLDQVKDKAKEKINEKKDKAKEKINAKKDELKNKARDKIDSKLPDSVKKKMDAVKNRGQQIKNKTDAAKRNINNAKDKVKNFKKNMNEKALRSAVNALPSQKFKSALDSEKGKRPIDAARNASNPIQAMKRGLDKLTQIVIVREIKKKLISYIPALSVVFFVVVVVLGVISKFTDSQIYAAGDPVGQGAGGIEQVDEKYKKFYENVEKYASSTDKYMVIAVLTAYKDNDAYSGTEGCSEDEISSGECVADTVDGVTTYSKSKMKKYIKEVSKAIEDSNYDVSEGDYKDPYNTGSNFFQWLYSDFLEEYYGEFLPEAESDDKKKEIVKFIYLYYKDIKKYDDSLICRNSYVNATCPQVTVTGNGAGVYSLEEYVEAVVAQELGYSGFPQAMRAQAIAARTYLLYTTDNCTKSIENSQNAQTLNFSKVTDEIREAVNDTAGLVLTNDGQIFKAEYSAFTKDHSCVGTECTGTFFKLPSEKTKGSITIDIAKLGIGLTTNDLKNGHPRGMSQYGASYFDKVLGYNYEEILKYFYDESVKISATSDSDGNNADHSASGEQVRLTVYGAQGTDVNLGVPYDNSRISSNSNGWRFYRDDDGKDYLVVATATEECLEKETGNCAAYKTRYSSIKYYNYYDKFVLSIKGVEYDAIVLDSCGACMKEKSDRGDTTNNRIDIWIDASAENNNTHGIGDYDGIVFDDKTIAAKGVCGASGNGLVTVDGYVQRVSRPQVNNSYYYVQTPPTDGNWGAAGTLEGECAWYATGRAKEILATLNNGGSWTHNNNGNTYCNAPEASNFQTSKDSTKPKPGAIVSWSKGTWGHVAIVESVNGNKVTISEAGLVEGPMEKFLCSSDSCIREKLTNKTLTRHQYCEADGSGCFNTRTVDIDDMDNLAGEFIFNCYVYLTDPK